MLRAVLPKPPSTNHIYAFTSRGGFARSYITKRGVVWFEEAGWLLKQQIKVEKPIQIPFRLDVDLYTILGDIDGILKPALDLLQKQNVIKNDTLVVELYVKKYKVIHRKEEKIILEIKSLQG